MTTEIIQGAEKEEIKSYYVQAMIYTNVDKR